MPVDTLLRFGPAADAGLIAAQNQTQIGADIAVPNVATRDDARVGNVFSNVIEFLATFSVAVAGAAGLRLEVLQDISGLGTFLQANTRVIAAFGGTGTILLPAGAPAAGDRNYTNRPVSFYGVLAVPAANALQTHIRLVYSTGAATTATILANSCYLRPIPGAHGQRNSAGL